MKREYSLYYENDNNEYIVYSSETNSITTMRYVHWSKLERTYHMLPPFEASEKGLFEYAEKFKEWATELKDHKIYLNRNQNFRINASFYYTLHHLARGFYKRVTKGKFEHHEPKTAIENSYIEDCYNGGLLYCDDDDGEYIESYAYDYTFDYPKCMASDKLFIPNKAGKEYKLNKIPDVNDLKTGFYRVKITCKNNDFCKLFSFSKKHTYTDRSIIQALKYKDKFDVKIELNQDLKYNCYLYDDKDLESGSVLFKKWFTILSELKEKFPKNGIVKFMGSSLYGQIETKHEIYKTEEEIVKEQLDVGVKAPHRFIIQGYKIYGIELEKNYKKLYCLTDTEKPREFNIRLKSFLTSYCRNKTARICTGHVRFGKNAEKNVVHDLNDVIRIHTDCVVFRKQMKDLESEDIPDLKKEEKSSGLIRWVNTSKYHNKTTGKYHGRGWD